MPRGKGVRNKNFPGASLQDAIRVADTIQDKASGMSINRILLAGEMNLSPSSSVYRDLLSASRSYGLTRGTEKADVVQLTDVGRNATSNDEIQIAAARRTAAMTPEPFARFYREYNNKNVPSPAVFRTWLEQNGDVPREHCEEAMDRITSDAKFVGLIRPVKGADYVYVSNGSPVTAPSVEDDLAETRDVLEETEAQPPVHTGGNGTSAPPQKQTKVFVGHGKNRTPLEQLKSILTQLQVPVAVAVDEAHGGRPVSRKVAELMRQCSSAIFILTADDVAPASDGESIARPSDNAIYELGAASVLYDNRIVIFKEENVTLTSDFSDLGHITFERDRLDAKLGELLRELVKFEIIEIRAKA